MNSEVSKEAITDPWTVQRLLHWTTQHFASKGISSSRLDSELLLSHILNCKRLDLYLRFDQPVAPAELKSFKELVMRRSKREPVAYILGRQEFYGRNFLVSPGVLIPRPETEHLVDEALKFMKTQSQDRIQALDIGCGSGALGLSLILENEKCYLTAVDISSVACSVTKSNAENLNAASKIEIFENSFMDFKNQQNSVFDIIVSNPPYISLNSKDTLEIDVVGFEPAEALFGGKEGFEILEQWIPKASALLKSEGLFLCEIGYDQGETVRKLAEASGLLKAIEIIKDYSGHSRILKAQKI